VKETAQTFGENKFHDFEFNTGEFIEAYASLAVGSVGPETMRDDLYRICVNLSETEDGELITLYSRHLRKQVERWSIHPDLKERIREIPLPGKRGSKRSNRNPSE